MAKAAPLSAELDLLCHCDLASDAQLAAFIAATPIFNWERFHKLVSFNAMGGLVHARLSPVAAGRLPSFLADYLADRHRHHGMVHLAQTSETARVVNLFSRAGISSVVLKGVATAQLLYQPHVSRRYSSDIDLLVSRNTFLEADRALLAAGYRRKWPEGDIPERGQDMLLHLAYAFTYVHSGNGLVVELHHRLTSNPYWLPISFPEILAETGEISLPNGVIRGLDGGLLLAYLAWHALGHMEYRVKWFGDFVRALLRADPTSPGLLDRSEQLGATRAVQLAWSVADRLYGSERLGRRFGPAAKGTLGSELARVVGGLERAEATPITRSFSRLPAELSFVRFLSYLAIDHRAPTFQILRELSDPRDAVTLGLGIHWRWLYAIAGPFFACARYFSGIGRIAG